MKFKLNLTALFIAMSLANMANGEELDEIQVTTQIDSSSTNPLSDAPKPNDIIMDKPKLRRTASTLGNALNGELGVHSSQFGGGASAPIIRGQEGVRLKVLQNGLDVVDMSQLSPDHAIAADTLLANKVEIVRGASTLLYSTASQAGVINVTDNRIPTAVPEKGYAVDAGIRYNSNSREKVENAAFSLGLGKHIVIRAEGLNRDADNYRVPTLQFNDQTVNQLPNSFNKSRVGVLGLSLVGERGYVGVAYSERHDKYGLVGHNHKFDSCYGHIIDPLNQYFVNRYYLHPYPHLMNDSDVREGAHFDCGSGHEMTNTPSHSHPFGHNIVGGPFIEMNLKRYEVRAELKDPMPYIEKIRANFGASQYYHDEKEGNSEPINIFKNKAKNVRLEFVHKPIADWRGVWGVQYQTQTSSAYVPRLTNPRQPLNYAKTKMDEIIQKINGENSQALEKPKQEAPTLGGTPNVDNAEFDKLINGLYITDKTQNTIISDTPDLTNPSNNFTDTEQAETFKQKFPHIDSKNLFTPSPIVDLDDLVSGKTAQSIVENNRENNVSTELELSDTNISAQKKDNEAEESSKVDSHNLFTPQPILSLDDLVNGKSTQSVSENNSENKVSTELELSGANTSVQKKDNEAEESSKVDSHNLFTPQPILSLDDLVNGKSTQSVSENNSENKVSTELELSGVNTSAQKKDNEAEESSKVDSRNLFIPQPILSLDDLVSGKTTQSVFEDTSEDNTSSVLDSPDTNIPESKENKEMTVETTASPSVDSNNLFTPQPIFDLDDLVSGKTAQSLSEKANENGLTTSNASELLQSNTTSNLDDLTNESQLSNEEQELDNSNSDDLIVDDESAEENKQESQGISGTGLLELDSLLNKMKQDASELSTQTTTSQSTEQATTPVANWEKRQIQDRSYALVENDVTQWSVFGMEQFVWRDFLFELGLRHERQKIAIDYDRALLARSKNIGISQKVQEPDLSPNKQHATSYSLATYWNFSSNYLLSLIFSHNERLPTSMELYYHGKHLATNSFEYGNKDLQKEKSNNAEIGLNYQNTHWNYTLNAYYNHFQNRIFKRTLNKEGNLSMNRYAQAKADYYGLEGKIDYQWNDNLVTGVFGDYVRGVLKDLPPLRLKDSQKNTYELAASRNAPRVPPLRLGVHFDWQITEHLRSNVRYTHAFSQHKVATLEAETQGYDQVDLGLSYQNQYRDLNYEMFVDVNNLLNAQIYSHSSYLPFVPQMGRNIVVGVNMSF